MQHVRIYAEGTVDNPDVPPIWVDAVIDNAGRIIGRHTLFGVQGSFSRREVDFYPFTLDEDGLIDFGRGFDEPPGERHAEFDLRNGAVKPERLLTLALANYGQWFYRIARIIPVPLCCVPLAAPSTEIMPNSVQPVSLIRMAWCNDP